MTFIHSLFSHKLGSMILLERSQIYYTYYLSRAVIIINNCHFFLPLPGNYIYFRILTVVYVHAFLDVDKVSKALIIHSLMHYS